jgi:hypothetical protein
MDVWDVRLGQQRIEQWRKRPGRVLPLPSQPGVLQRMGARCRRGASCRGGWGGSGGLNRTDGGGGIDRSQGK